MATWSNTSTPNSSAPTTGAWTSHKMLARDSEGRLYAVFMNSTRSKLQCNYSDDDGATWSTAHDVLTWGSGTDNDYVVQMGLDDIPMVFAFESSTANDPIRVLRYDGDESDTWTAKTSINTSSASIHRWGPKPVCQSSNGVWYVFYPTGSTSQTALKYVYSSDDGGTWSSVQSVKTYAFTIPIFRSLRDGISVICDREDNLHVVVTDIMDSNTSRQGVWYHTGDASSGNPASWTSEEIWVQSYGLTSNNYPSEPTVAVDSNGVVHAAWRANNSNNSTVYYPWYANRIGGSWSTAIRADTSYASSFGWFGFTLGIGTDDIPWLLGNAGGLGSQTTNRNPAFVKATSNAGSTWNSSEELLDTADNWIYSATAAQYTNGLQHTRLATGYVMLSHDVTNGNIEFWESTSPAVTWMTAGIEASVLTSIELSQSQVFDANETISEDGIKRDLGGKSVARDGTQSRIWVLGVDTSLDDTIALYTPSDGITWIGETITSNFAARGHAMVIGDGGEPVVALHKDGTTDIEVWQRSSGGVWSKKATVSAGSASDIDAFGIHFDGTTYHLVYMDKASTSVAAASRCRLRHRTSTNLTSWSSATTVDAGHKDGPYGNSKSMCAAMDSNNDIHVVYGLANGSGEQKLNYVVYDESAGTWGSVEEIEDFGVNFLNNDRLIYIDLAIDENDKPHFVGVIEADQILGASNGFVDDDDPAVFYWERTGSSWSSALVVDATDDTVQANYNPTIHMNNGTTAIVHWGSQTTSGAELKRAQRSGGGWTRTRVGNVDQFGTLAANFEADAAHYVRTNEGYLVTGDFLVLRGSIIMIQSVATVWGDGTTLMESIPTFSQTLQVQGRAAPSTDFEVSQTVTVNRAYSETREHDATFEAEVSGVNYDRNRSDTRTPVFENGIGYTLVPTGGGGDTHYIQVTENRLNFSQEVRQLVQTEFVDELTFSQEIGLTLGKTVEQDVEFSQDIDAIRIKLLTADGDVLIDDAVLMNKTLNLGVSTDIAFSQQGIPIRDWNAYSTHFDPGWGSEDSTTQVVFLHPSSLPTTSVTMMRPDFGDVREDRRRSGAIRRNRSGQPRSFKAPVYSTFVLTWTGIPRFVAEEFRTRMVSYMGDKLRYQDHNGVFQEVIIADEALIRNQGNHEHCTLSITLAKVERIDVAPTTVG